MVTLVRPSPRRSIASLAWELHDAIQKKERQAAEPAKPLAVAKADLVRSEPYRRLVAAGACEHCGISGYSQAAHLPPEGKAIKVTDLDTFALCTVHPGPGGDVIEGCHKRFDNYELFPREAIGAVARKWIKNTQRRVLATGKWPKAVPVPAWLEKKNGKKTQSPDAAAAGGPAVPGAGRHRQSAADRRGQGAAAGGRDARGAAKPARGPGH